MRLTIPYSERAKPRGAVFSAGLAMCGLALCSWYFDHRDSPRLATFFTIYGVNAIALYVGSGVLARTLTYVQVEGVTLKEIIYGNLFASWLSPFVASLGYAVAWIGGWFLLLFWMYRRRLFIKV